MNSLRALLENKFDNSAENPSNVLLGWVNQERDFESIRVMKHTNTVWRRLSQSQRSLLLQTAECIARAELAKAAWQPKQDRQRYETLARNAVSAAKLADELGNWFPRPWNDERAMVSVLVSQLVSFVHGALDATCASEQYVAAMIAREALHKLKRSISRKIPKMPWQLIGRLAWLASRKKVLHCESSEKTVRRYFANAPTLRKSPAADCWRRNWELVRRISDLTPEIQSEKFEKLARRGLSSESLKSV